ncbi:MAG: aromatic amino acid lyase, partial [Bacteroidia bacterium]|nr:aromatic amino acid lyase [Bacteroidia bacterium]
YSAAALVSQNKTLCMPSSADTIPSSNNQEDHVSMGANAAIHTWQVIKNTQQVLGIECMCASQALSFREPLQTGIQLRSVLADYRNRVPVLTQDRYLHPDLLAAAHFVGSYSLA